MSVVTTPSLSVREHFCAQADVPSDGKILTRVVKGRMVAVARRSAEDDTVVAFDGVCPHMQASFRFGRMVNGEVICPLHFFRFDTATGQASACNKSLMALRIYPVHVEGGQVYVDLTA